MYEVELLLLAVGRQVGDGGGRALFAQQFGGQACAGRDIAGGLIIDGGDKAADLHPGLGRR